MNMSRLFILRPVATAHTDTDMTVFDDGSATLFAGDLIAMGLTPSLDGSLKGWLGWLDTVPDPLPDRIVPGHGPVMDSRDKAIAPTRAYLGALRDAARAALDAGQPLSQAAATASPHKLVWLDLEIGG